MTTVNLEYVQSHLAELIEKAANGEPFIIERAGHPLVQVSSIGSSLPKPNRQIGMLDGQFNIPDDIKAIDQEEIIALFEGRG